MSPVRIVTSVAILLGLLGLIRLYRVGFSGIKKRPLWVYVLAVGIVWAIILAVAAWTGAPSELHDLKLVFMGYAIGFFAMYLASRVYRS